MARIRVHKHLLSSLLIYSILMALLTLQMLINSNVSSGSASTASVSGAATGDSGSTSAQSSVTPAGSLADAQEVLLINQDNPQQHPSKSGSISAPASNLTATNLTTFFCICVSLAVKYFRSTSYLWMFNEGKAFILVLFCLSYRNVFSKHCLHY